ncbi:hypothetical protein ACFQ0X_27635 [Streptomyces rectiviolaceus]|uniref:hypothetical protein n=1 Tax=Streptomyces rectiviolaceus TaxID=332591 RepID=UPI00363E0A2C
MTSPTTTSLARLDAGPTPPADAAEWLTGHLDQIRASVAGHGAVLVRGLGLDGRAAASAALRQVIGEAVTEREGFAPATVTATACTPPRTGPRTSPCACTTSSVTPPRCRA